MSGGLKQPYNLSKRVEWLRNYYFDGVSRKWNNEFNTYTTGTDWDVVFDETSYYIVPEVYPFFDTFTISFLQSAAKIEVDSAFWKKSLIERRAELIRRAVTEELPVELLDGDLIAGARFNLQVSRGFNRSEASKRAGLMYGNGGIRNDTLLFRDTGYGNCGATAGHIIPDYPRILREGFKGIIAELDADYLALDDDDRKGSKGATLRAMRDAAEIPQKTAERYRALCTEKAGKERDRTRQRELVRMAEILSRVPYEPARNFWEALQSLWITHMLVLSDECYPGAGVSFGNLDRYLLPYWEKSIADGEDREFLKELLKCFWVHSNYAYDAMITTGNQGITAGYGQLLNLSGIGADGKDTTNDLTWALLEVIDEMSPILEPKPNVRLHTDTPEKFLDKVVDMISASQGAPFLLNFDERSMAGMLREAKRAGVEEYINESNVSEYASVGCLENTMCGNDRSGTVDCNLNLFKAIELVLGNGENLITYTDALWGKPYRDSNSAPKTGEPHDFKNFREFYAAFETQLEYIIGRIVELYNRSDYLRAKYHPTPYLSCIVKGCADKGADVTAGGAELRFVTIEGVTFATTVDSLLAIKYLVYDKKLCDIDTLIAALKANWVGYEMLQAAAKNKAPKYGRDDPEADAIGKKVMEKFSDEAWKYKTSATDAQFRPGMLSWNYWIGSGFILPASPDGRENGQFLSNAICPVNGADINGPTANANSVGTVLGGNAEKGDYKQWLNCLPNGASHTITLSPSLFRNKEHKKKLKSFLRGYVQNGGTALQINVLDADMLRDAQNNPEEYRNLLVRITGYNAYFTSIGRELQNEIIARESHNEY